MPPMDVPTRELVIDACGLINLLATRREIEVAGALGLRLVIPRVAAEQVGYLWTPPDDEGAQTKVVANFEALIRQGRLVVQEIEDDAVVDALVTLATQIDDADAACIALAGVLQRPLVTDDKKARGIAQRTFPAMELMSSLSLLHDASRALGWSDTVLRQVAFDVYHRGNFDPPRADPLADWYRALLRT